MASKSDKLRNLDFQAESLQTMPHNPIKLTQEKREFWFEF